MGLSTEVVSGNLITCEPDGLTDGVTQVNASFGLMAGGAIAAVGSPELGKEYTVLDNAQPVDSGKKIEVIEFFAYYCPHCYALEPLMAESPPAGGTSGMFFNRAFIESSSAFSS